MYNLKVLWNLFFVCLIKQSALNEATKYREVCKVAQKEAEQIKNLTNPHLDANHSKK